MRTLYPREDPLRRCLKLEEWPEADRLAWEQAMQPGDILDGTVGAGFHWSTDTRKKCRKGYGRWLTFLITSDRFDRSVAPADRITPEAVIAYIEVLQETVSSWTTSGRLTELLSVAKAIFPQRDWSWLRAVARKLERRTVATRQKLQLLRPAGEISAWAFRRMDEVERNPALLNGPGHYRDALAIALLIACPTMRLGNLAMIRIGTHLIRMSDGYRLQFAPQETKTRRPFTIPVPASLVPFLDHYMENVRPILLDGNDHDRLWITRYGQPMPAGALYNGITTATKRAFGRPINPHLFRDCAVTTVALEDPEHIGIAAPILGHTDPRTTEAHYIQANAIVAGRRLRHSIDTLREQYRPRRHSRKPRGDPS